MSLVHVMTLDSAGSATHDADFAVGRLTAASLIEDLYVTVHDPADDRYDVNFK